MKRARFAPNLLPKLTCYCYDPVIGTTISLIGPFSQNNLRNNLFEKFFTQENLHLKHLSLSLSLYIYIFIKMAVFGYQLPTQK